jgi:hypothetical protein
MWKIVNPIRHGIGGSDRSEGNETLPLKANGYLDFAHFSEIHQPNKAT